jgi:hypothetical protein
MSLQEETVLSQQLTQQADEDDYDATVDEDDYDVTVEEDDCDEGNMDTRAREQFQNQKSNLFNQYLPIFQNIVKEAGASFAAFQELESRLPDLECICKEASRKEEEE